MTLVFGGVYDPGHCVPPDQLHYPAAARPALAPAPVQNAAVVVAYLSKVKGGCAHLRRTVDPRDCDFRDVVTRQQRLQARLQVGGKVRRIYGKTAQDVRAVELQV